MKEVGTHRNIVSMLGYWIQSHPIMLIMEYVPNGDLLQWLRNKRQQVSLLYQLYQQKFAGLCFAFCLKNIFSPFTMGLRTDIIHRTQTQTNEFLNFVCLFVIKVSSLSGKWKTITGKWSENNSPIQGQAAMMLSDVRVIIKSSV